MFQLRSIEGDMKWIPSQRRSSETCNVLCAKLCSWWHVLELLQYPHFMVSKRRLKSCCWIHTIIYYTQPWTPGNFPSQVDDDLLIHINPIPFDYSWRVFQCSTMFHLSLTSPSVPFPGLRVLAKPGGQVGQVRDTFFSTFFVLAFWPVFILLIPCFWNVSWFSF